MANLFGRNYLREKAQQIETKDIQSYLDIVSTWHNDYHHGSLKTDKETSREQQYNRDFFLTILGYQEKPATPYSFEPKATTEKGQLPDAVIGYTDKSNNIKNISAVVELKGASVPLDRPQRREGNMSPIQQGFKYKTQYRSCPFVIVSNFWEFRLYNDTQLDYEIWTLDDLVNPANDYILFKTWFVLLSKDNLVAKQGKSVTENLLSDIRVEQEEIGKKFYKVYKQVRLELLRDIYKNNRFIKKDIDTGIEKAQKIIDRIVFAAFAEDKGLLPDDTLHKVIRASENSAFGGSLWNTFKGFFDAIDVGSDKLDIPDGYNGGLFARDEVLNNLEISDEPLRAVAELGSYNFSDDLSVNILGHIFEQSISDLEEIKNKVKESQNIETLSQSRRKKDGIFYTPDYIVHYIVDNSLGTYLREEEERLKQEFKLHGDINDKNYQKREKQAYGKYQDFLQNVKVVDPACGSGAFLVYVFDYLLAENKRVNDILGGTLFSTDDYVRDILQNNIYGVDLNEESVEITKLSLWLKSAQKGKKLTALDKNIRCGNSLIDDEKIAGSKAFNWHKEFAEIFKHGGFDVVVGNPPYVQLSKVSSTTQLEKDYLINRYGTSGGRLNTFIFFIHILKEILNTKGLSGYIIPNTILSQEYYKQTRELLVKELSVNQIVTYPYLPFADAVVENITLIISKEQYSSIVVYESGKDNFIKTQTIQKSDITPKNYSFSINTDDIVVKIDSQKLPVLDAYANVNQAIALKGDKSLSVKSVYSDGYFKLIDGRHINRYSLNWGGDYLEYKLERIHSGKQKDIFLAPEKLLFRRVSANLVFTYDDDQFFALNTIVVVTPKYGTSTNLKALLTLLNSKLLNYYYVKKFKSTKKVFSEIQARTVAQLPIANFVEYETKLTSSATTLIDRNIKLSDLSTHFQKVVTNEYYIGKWQRKLNKWWRLDFTDFTKALKIEVSLQQKDELLSLFEKYKTQCAEIDYKIQETDHEIDQLVYKLYKLTSEEIAIIEKEGN